MSDAWDTVPFSSPNTLLSTKKEVVNSFPPPAAIGTCLLAYTFSVSYGLQVVARILQYFCTVMVLLSCGRCGINEPELECRAAFSFVFGCLRSPDS